MPNLEPCPSCQSKERLAIYEHGGLFYVKCTQCFHTGPGSDPFISSDYSRKIATTTAKRRWNRAAKKAAQTTTSPPTIGS